MIGFARQIKSALAIAAALSVGAGVAFAAVPPSAKIPPREIAEAKRVLETNGYTDIAVLGGNDRLVTASATKQGQKSVVDVDPMTQIILPHVDLPPIPAQLAPLTGLATPR